jgi:hypothetical protein
MLSLFFLIGAGSFLLGEVVMVVGVAVQALAVAAILFLSDDLFPILLPILNITVATTTLIGRIEMLQPCYLLVIPAVVGFVFHLFRYRKVLRIGKTFYGVLAAAVAILLSGIGHLKLSDYADPTALAYYLLMTVGLVAFYLLFVLIVKVERSYDPKQYMLSILTFLGAFCAIIVLSRFLHWIGLSDGELDVYEYFDFFHYRNTIANLLIIALPTPFFFAAYVVKRPAAHIGLFLLGCVYYCALLMTASRTAMIFGTLLFALSMVLYVAGREPWYFKVISVSILLVALAGLVGYLYEPIYRLLSFRFSEGITYDDEPRIQLLLRAIEDFKQYPIFGIGFISSKNADIYAADGCITWYHMYVPQIFGSLGLVGCAAYGFQLFQRLRLVLKAPNDRTVALALCYLGLLLYSQTDPGEFVPFPFAAIAVLIFVLLEHHEESLAPMSGNPS